MIIALDTNVLVSAFISKAGPSARLIDIILTLEDVELVLSDEIIEEFVEVMSRDELLVRFDYSLAHVEELARLLKKSARMVKPKSRFRAVRADPADNIVLNTAYDGNCDFIVSGDHHLLDLKKFKGIRVVSPKQMLDLLSKIIGCRVPGAAMSESMSGVRNR